MAQLTTPEPETWLSDYGDLLYRYALLRVRSEATAEDLVQDTLLAGIQSFRNFNRQSSVSTWLIGILKHKIIDHFRKSRLETIDINEFTTDDELMSYQFDDRGHWKVSLVEWTTPDQSLNDEQFWQAFHRCLSRLPENMANLFILRVMEGLSSEDCCKVLNFNSTNQLWVTLSRVRMRLRQCLDVQWFDKPKNLG